MSSSSSRGPPKGAQPVNTRHADLANPIPALSASGRKRTWMASKVKGVFGKKLAGDNRHTLRERVMHAAAVGDADDSGHSSITMPLFGCPNFLKYADRKLRLDQCLTGG